MIFYLFLCEYLWDILYDYSTHYPSTVKYYLYKVLNYNGGKLRMSSQKGGNCSIRSVSNIYKKADEDDSTIFKVDFQ